MLRKPARKSLTLLALLLVVLLPALVLVVTLAFLQFVHALALGEVSLLVLVELYLIEVLLFGGVSYLLYRLAVATLAEEFPEWLESEDEE